MSNSFKTLNLNSNIMLGLEKSNITKPTDIQKKSIPLAISGKDIIGQSPTGSGKTLAYIIPILEKINPKEKNIQAIILAPTHELVVQINKEVQKISKNSELPIKSAIIMGNVNIKRQIEKLKDKPSIVIGTTGRILELIDLKKLKTHFVKTIVVDECDKMLSDYNLPGIEKIIKTTLKDRQLMFFSATINEKIIDISNKIMKTPEIIKISIDTYTENIEHIYLLCEERDKVNFLRKIIASVNPERALVFINKNEKIQTIENKLKHHHIKAYGIFGNSTKIERKKGIDNFKNGKIKILISSDLSARGLDIENITHIINMDISENMVDYMHRIGRTGRMGKSGMAISLVTKSELNLLKKIERKYNLIINCKKIYKSNFLDCN